MLSAEFNPLGMEESPADLICFLLFRAAPSNRVFVSRETVWLSCGGDRLLVFIFIGGPRKGLTLSKVEEGVR